MSNINTVNDRGNQPGTGHPAPHSTEPPPPRTISRGIEPGANGAPPPKVPTTREQDELRPRAQDAAMYGILSKDAVDVVRKTGRVLCLVKGCEQGPGKSPYEAKTMVGLRTHVRAKHKNVEEAVVVRVLTAILKENDDV